MGEGARVLDRSVRAALAGLSLIAAAAVASSSPAGASSAGQASRAVWLCRPGQPNDPCDLSTSDTVVSSDGSTKLTTTRPAAAASKFDCFYVYPTVSSEPGDNADLTVQPVEIDAAELQASRFSQVCRVWAPMYRQRTSGSLTSQGLGGNHKADTIAYDSLLSGWKDYLAHDNRGRPIIFIGHSQGAAMLIRLLHSVIDPSPKLRRLMVSALIMGGNVQVPTGKDVGGSFRHIPTCASAGQTHCVIAYSSFGTTPPANSLFGRPGQGVSLQSDQTTAKGQQVACVNPVTFSGAPGALLPFFLAASSKMRGVRVTTPWVSYPGLYTGTCRSSGGATWLQITANSAPADRRSRVQAILGPTWGLHLYDINLALGNLVLDVAAQEAAYR
jgi:hypothetical protein